MLSLPLAFAKAGIVVATGLMVFSALITEFSLYILCSCARRTGCTSYMDIVRFAFGPLAEIFTTSILLIFLLGVLVAFNVLLKGIFAPMARDVLASYEFPFIAFNTDSEHFDDCVLLFILVLVSPLMLQRNLYALRHVCYVGFSSVCVIVMSIGVRATQRTIDVGFSEIKYFTTSWEDALFAFPIVVLAFLCAYNVVEVHGALINPTRQRVKGVIHTAVTSSFVLFEAFALVGYFYAYDTCRGNIFLNFGKYGTRFKCFWATSTRSSHSQFYLPYELILVDPDDSLIMVGRLGMGLALIFTTPVVTLPCREACLSIGPQILTWWREDQEQKKLVNSTAESTFLVSRDEESSNDPSYKYSSISSAELDAAELPVARQKTVQERNVVIHVVTTMVITIAAFFVAIAAPDVAVVWSILGSSLGMIIGFIIPCGCYLKIRGRKGMTRTNIGAGSLLAFSIVVATVCTAQTIRSIERH